MSRGPGFIDNDDLRWLLSGPKEVVTVYLERGRLLKNRFAC
jgi:hypothetical protein